MKSPAFRFYPADFLMGTADMGAAEVGAYIRLLCHQWDRGFVPKEKAARLAGAKVSASVLAKFVETGGELRNQRMEDERKKQAEYRAQQSQRGKAGAESRWNGSRDGTRHANANGQTMAPPSSGQCPNDGFPFPSSSSSTNNPEPEQEAGAFAEQDECKAQPHPNSFSELALDDLSNDAVMLDWYEYATSQPEPLFRASDANLLNVFGAAVHALRVKKIKGKPVQNRVALFCSVVRAGEGKGGWSVITQAEEDEARKRVARLPWRPATQTKTDAPPA